MDRLTGWAGALGAAAAAVAVYWSALAWSASIAIDPAQLTLTPAECVTVCKAAPDPPVPPSPGPIPPPGWNGVCAGFPRTVHMPLNFNAPSRMLTSQWGDFGINDVLVVSFTTGGVQSVQPLRLTGAEYQAAPNFRDWTVSKQACDFGPQPYGMSSQGTQSITFVFAIGAATSMWVPALQPATTYFMNVRNSAGTSCPGSVCNMFFDLLKSGYP